VADWQFDMFNSPNRAVNLLPPLQIPRSASVMDPPRGSPRLQAPLVSLGPVEALPRSNYRFVCYEGVE
jgi:hypothetical protein